MTRSFLLVVLVSFLAFTSEAQKSTGKYNSLLWRISKPGMAKDSYLYGTMHATDKKLFYFTDSLYHFIEKTEGFATELDMAELFPVVIESSINDTLKSKLLVDVVRPAWLNPFKSKLEKKFGKSMGKPTVGDVQSVQSGMSNDFLRKGEMNTIMDIYLSETARNQGKWVGGIEDFEDQLKVKNTEEYVMSLIMGSLSKPKESEEFLDKLVGIYLDEALDKIDLSSALWRGSEKIILINRNIKMARRMDSLMSIRSSVFAVGAAHIPGDTGVVELLRQRGYTVSPVFSKNRIAPKPLGDDNRNWVQVHPSDNFFNMLMPGKPTVLKSEERPGYEPMMFTDIRNLLFYLSVGMDISGAGNMKKEDMYTRITEGFSKKGTVKSQKSITVKGVEGKEYFINSKDGDLRLQIFLAGRYMAMNVVASYKSDSLYGSKVNRFFESISFDPKQISSSADSKSSNTSLAVPKAGFKIDFPGKYSVKKGFGTEADTTWEATIYSHIGRMGQVGCWMITMESKPGYFSNTDTGYFHLVRQNNEENLKTKVSSYREFEFEGYPACEFILDYKVDKEKGSLIARVIIRGNKRYYFYTVYSPGTENEAAAKKFMNSFQFVDIPSEPWNWTHSTGSGIKFWAPGAFNKTVNDDDSTHDFSQTYDKIRSNTIMLMKEALPKYQWWPNDSLFFASQQDRFVQNGDTLLSTTYDTIGKYKSVELIIGLTDNHLVKKVKLMPYGDSLITLFGFASKVDFNLPDYKKLFDQPEYTIEKASNYYKISKAKSLLNNLNSTDSATFAEASSAIETASFQKEDLPLLHQALLKRYQDSTDYYSANDKLMSTVVDLDDGSTIEFVKEQYGKLKGVQEEIRTDFLSLLIELETKESFDLFKQLSLTDKPAKGDITEIGFAFNDSLELTRTLFPDILRLSSDTSWANLLTRVIPQLLDSGYLKLEALKPYYQNFYSAAEYKYKKLLSDSSIDWETVRLCDLLGYFATPESYKILNQFVRVEDPDSKMEAMLALARNNQPVSAAEWEKIAANKRYRLDLYDRLNTIKKGALFPAKYKNPKSFAESELYLVATDDGDPTSFEFIGERSFKFKGKTQKFFLFKARYEYDEEVSEYLLIAGPNGKTLVTESEVATMSSDPYDPKKINEQVKELLKWYEKEE